MAAIRRFVPETPAFLASGGWLLVEIGYDQAEAVTELLRAVPDLELVKIVKDYAGLPRLAVARKKI
jgi:release factor glutamine methyltransferase